MYTCKCGAEFSLEPYHDQRAERHTTCHSCYRKLLHCFDNVIIKTDLTGFNIGIMSVAYASKGDIMVVMEYNFERGVYLLVAGGFYFWAGTEDVKRAPQHAIQYAKTQYEPISITDHILTQIQNDIDAYLNTQAITKHD